MSETTAVTPSPWKKVGKYNLGREIGRGGMGIVCEGTYRKQRVAVKVLPLHIANEQARVYFLREAEALKKLCGDKKKGHPNVVPFVDHGVEQRLQGELLYLVMEYIEGISLEKRLKEGALPPDVAIEVARQICRGIAYAHAHNVIHRDLKPANIMLVNGREGQPDWVKVVDFGIARIAQAEQQLTRTGFAFGTPGFMPLEQYEGGRSVDGRVDVFAIGCLLYLMCTGELAFPETGMVEAMYRQANGPLPERHNRIEPELWKIVLRCLQKNKEDRYTSVGALLEVLEGYKVPVIPPTGVAVPTPVPGAESPIAATEVARHPNVPAPPTEVWQKTEVAHEVSVAALQASEPPPPPSEVSAPSPAPLPEAPLNFKPRPPIYIPSFLFRVLLLLIGGGSIMAVLQGYEPVDTQKPRTNSDSGLAVLVDASRDGPQDASRDAPDRPVPSRVHSHGSTRDPLARLRNRQGEIQFPGERAWLRWSSGRRASICRAIRDGHYTITVQSGDHALEWYCPPQPRRTSEDPLPELQHDPDGTVHFPVEYIWSQIPVERRRHICAEVARQRLPTDRWNQQRRCTFYDSQPVVIDY